MKTNKKVKVIMLPTNDEIGSLYGYKDKSMLFKYKPNGYMKTEAEKEFTQHYHLYFISDDEIREGDWVINISTSEIWRTKYSDEEASFISRKKIIATTDTSLYFDINGYRGDLLPDCTFTINLPQPSKAFIEKYCDSNGIDEVLVEYESDYLQWRNTDIEDLKDTLKPKVNSHNEITIQ